MALRPLPAFFTVQLLLGAAAGLSGQSSELAGGVIDASGSPVPDATVVLHRLEDQGGRDLATATTTTEGRFTFQVPDGPADAIHFAAVRYEEALFVGTFFRTDDLPLGEYVIHVDSLVRRGAVVMPDGSVIPPSGPGGFPGAGAAAEPSSGSGSAGATRGPEPPSRLLTAAVLGLLVVSGGSILLLARDRDRRRRRRQLLIELATLQERHAASGSAPDPSRQASYQDRRATLYERLRANS